MANPLMAKALVALMQVRKVYTFLLAKQKKPFLDMRKGVVAISSYCSRSDPCIRLAPFHSRDGCWVS